MACNDGGLSPAGHLEIMRARAQWESLGLVHYTVEARRICFCPPLYSRWHELTVSNDSVIAMRQVDPMASPSDDLWEVPLGAIWSVESVFAYMEDWRRDRGRARRGERLVATFDHATGMPLRVEAHAEPGTLDGGVTFEFRALEPGLTALQRAPR